MIPGAHILLGFSHGFRQRHAMKALLDSTPPEQTLLHIKPEQLAAAGITAVALDFDGVLAHHGAAEPLPEATAWLQQCAATIGSANMFILSNKPTEERRSWFASHFPAMRFIAGVRKKPYPDGILHAAALAGVAPHAILMVDDRLLTGCLAASSAGAIPCYIRAPYASYRSRPLAELFFALLRRIEQYFVRMITPA